MHIRIIKIGKTAKEYLPLQEKFITFLQPNQLEIICLKGSKNKEPQAIKIAETEMLLNKAADDWPTIMLTESGPQHTSHEFAQKITDLSEATGRLQMIIGGAYGFTKEAKQSFPNKVALSKLTFPHDLAHIVLLEQLYRAITIQRGKSYHY